MIKKILVSQPKPASDKSPYYDIANEFGVELVFRPFFKVEGITAKEFRQQKISILSQTAVVFTSRHAIDNYFKLAKEMRLTIPEDMKYFCVTETISLYIQKYVQYRKRKVFFGTTGKIDDLVPVMAKHKTEKYLIPLSDVHNDHVKKLLDSVEGDEKTGVQIVIRALEAPVRQIAANAGLEGSVIIDKILSSGKIGYGFDAYNETFCDMVQAGIVDPTKVSRSALQNAASVAATVLTTEAVVADIKEEKPAAAMPDPGMGGGMY